MNTLLYIFALLIAFLIPYVHYLKEHKSRLKSESALAVVKLMGIVDDRIFRIRCDDPEDWPMSREAQALIVQRIALHEEYSSFLGHQLLRDCNYMNELMGSVVSK